MKKDLNLIKIITLSWLILCFMLSNVALAQVQTNEKTREGVVLDVDGVPLIGLTVSIQGTTNAVMTDVDGNYSIKAKDNDILVFTYIGYGAQEIPVEGKTQINVVMRESTIQMEDVVVVGYGTQKKVSVIGAVSNASVKELQSVPSASFSNALAGQLPGIITRQTSGEPGFDGAQLYIRGLATLNTGQDFTAPLVLVDGVERDINLVNSQEVESFTILKDASATAVYGVRGANGVILITTKKGEKGKQQVTFRSEIAMLTGIRFPKYIQSYEFANLMNEAAANSNFGTVPWSSEEIQKFQDGSDPYLYPNVNWIDEVFKKDTWQTTQNVNVSGGSEKVRYYVNLGLTGKDGLYKEDKSHDWKTKGGKFRRYNLRSNIDIDLSKELSLEIGLASTIQDRSYQGTSAGAIWSAIRQTSPLIYPVRNPDGSIAGGGTTAYLVGNPYGLATQTGYTQMFVSTNQGTLGAHWDLSRLITPGLSVNGKFSFDHYYFNEVGRKMDFEVKQYLGKNDAGEDQYQTWREETDMKYSIMGQVANYSIYWEGAVNYDRTFGNMHGVTGMLLFNRREFKNLTAGTSLDNLPSRNQGLAGRFSYNYESRYFAEFNFGYNGSEQFPKNSRYGFFPSLSLGWVLSNEKFWNPAVVNNLKIRGSVGKVGNDRAIGDRFLYVTALNKDAAGYWFGSGQSYTGSGIEEKKFGLPLKWETSTKYNLGFDIGLFNKLTFQIDAFKERREDILLKRESIPSYLGLVPHGTPYGNVGIVDNKGFDASIEFKNSTDYGLTYALRGNFTFARNKIVEDDKVDPDYAYQNTKGTSLTQAFGMISLGFFESEEEIENWAKSDFQSVIIPGDVKYKDVNEDGFINEKDRVFLGYPQIPEIMFGFGGTVTYKNLDATIHFSGVANRSVFLNGDAMYPFALEYPNYNVMREYYDNRWIPGADNSNAKYPTVIAGKNNHNNRNSTLYMRDGTYVKLQNAEIGYTIPRKWSNAIRINGARFFLNGTNLLTWDKVKVMDPEMDYGSTYPQQRTINLGMQINF